MGKSNNSEFYGLIHMESKRLVTGVDWDRVPPRPICETGMPPMLIPCDRLLQTLKVVRFDSGKFDVIMLRVEKVSEGEGEL